MSGDDEERGEGDSDEFDSVLQLVARADSRPVPGGTIGGRFKIVTVAGRGGFGAVYRAVDDVTGREVALKVLRDGTTDVARFEREAELLATVHHPNVVSYVAHGLMDEGAPYLAMEWLEGVDLGYRLREGELELMEALRVATRAAEGLAAAHTVGIIHRDVKPTNLYLAGFDADDVRVIDFGVARALSSTTPLTATGAVIGTPAYMAPEQARGGRELTPSADVFALGCVLFECLTGAPPFVGQSAAAVLARVLAGDAPRLRAVSPGAPPIVDSLLARMLAHNTRDRFSDGAVAATAIDEAMRSLVETTATSVDRGAGGWSSSLRVTASPWRGVPTDLSALVQSLGGEVVDRSFDGALSTFAGGSPAEVAGRAARCTVALREQDESLRMRVTTTRPEATRRGALGPGRASSSDALPEGVTVDARTAALLAKEYILARHGAWIVLVDKRDG